MPIDWVILVGSCVVTAALAGLSWTVQLVNYPLLDAVDPAAFAAYHRGHVRRIGWVVAPLMAAEAGLAAGLLAWSPGGGLTVAAGLGVPVVGVWALTAWGAVPLHRRLEGGTSERTEIVRRLVAVHWGRTALWTLRTVALASLVLAECWVVATG